MKIFVTGVNSQLGHDVDNELVKRENETVGSDGTAITSELYVVLDITSKDAVAETTITINPDAVIHCVTWTAVDMAENDDKVELVRAVSVGGTRYIAEVTKNRILRLVIFLSTMYFMDWE